MLPVLEMDSGFQIVLGYMAVEVDHVDLVLVLGAFGQHYVLELVEVACCMEFVVWLLFHVGKVCLSCTGCSGLPCAKGSCGFIVCGCDGW